MATIINRTARFRLLVHRAEELPFTSPHLGTGQGGAGRGVEEEADEEGIALLDYETGEFVEPEGAVDGWGGGRGEEEGGLADYGDGGGGG
jgi:hypothetical protein